MSELNPITGLPIEDAQQVSAEAEKIGKKEINTLEALAAAEEFKKSLKWRSFSGRHPELGPMIKCVVCKRRHRDNERCLVVYANKPGTPEGESNPMVAETKRLRLAANPYWRPKHGRFVWFNTLKKFIKLT
jgi:hypothetical protein